MNLNVNLNHSSAEPLYQQLSNQIESLIRGKILGPGCRLPSSRKLAENLSVSRCTITLAYDNLVDRGLLTRRSSSGTFVASGPPDKQNRMPTESPCDSERPIDFSVPLETAKRSTRLSSIGKRLMSDRLMRDIDAELFDEMNHSSVSSSRLPVDQWLKTMSHLKGNPELLKNSIHDNYDDLLGMPHLRETLATYLYRTRAIPVDTDNLVVFSSSQIALDIFSLILCEDGDRVVVENPGYPGMRRSIVATGGSPVGVPVDGHGLNTDLLRGLRAKLAYVTPGRQAPTGVVMSRSRREELLAWANDQDAYIIEDDFDTELSYAPFINPALKANDSQDRVIYISSFWTALFPLTRIAFAVLPPQLVEPVKRARAAFDRHVPALEQSTLAEFMKRGYLDRHIRKTRLELQNTRNTLIKRLNELFGQLVKVSPATCGSTLMVTFVHGKPGKEQIIHTAAALRLPMVPTNSFYLEGDADNQFLISFSDIEANVLDHKLTTLHRLLSRQEELGSRSV